MSLYLRRNQGGALPCLHAFVIGVGDYPCLGAGRDRSLPALQALSSTPISALAITRWLEQDYHNPHCPLGTIELVLSPAQTLLNGDGESIDVEAATMANIETAFHRWFQRCDDNKQNIAFFYFAGHGLLRDDHFLLAADFGDPRALVRWKNCINFTRMRSGMERCRAQTQFFFVDACQDTPDEILSHIMPQGQNLVDATLYDRVASSTVCCAAPAKYPAYGIPGGPTFFCQALLQCLNGVAGYRTRGNWVVDSGTLMSALVHVMENLGRVHGLDLRAEVESTKPAPLHYPLDGAVMLLVDCLPTARRREVEISVRHSAGAHAGSPAGDSRPWTHTLPPGEIQIALITSTSTCNHVDRIQPPAYEWEGRL